jgi:hypothetical protein
MTQIRTMGLCIPCAADGYTDVKPMDTITKHPEDGKPAEGLCHRHYMRQNRAAMKDDEIAAAQQQKACESTMKKKIKGFSAALTMLVDLQEWMKKDDVASIRETYTDYLCNAIAELGQEDEEPSGDPKHNDASSQSSQIEEALGELVKSTTTGTSSVPTAANPYKATDADVPEIIGKPARVAEPKNRKPQLKSLMEDLDLAHLRELAAQPTELNVGHRSYLPREVQAAAKILLDENLRRPDGQTVRPLTTSEFEPQGEIGSLRPQEPSLPEISI